MKKTVLLCAAALLVGLVLGFAGGHSLLFGAGQLSRNSDTPASTAISALMPSTPLPSPAVQALDTQDNLPLLERGGQVLLALRDRDYAALAQLTHPTAGVTFTPYSTVTREYDLVFTPQQLAGLGEDTTVYTWGVIDGKGDPIRMTGEEYISSSTPTTPRPPRSGWIPFTSWATPWKMWPPLSPTVALWSTIFPAWTPRWRGTTGAP